jgi:hypothetical protein
MIYDWDGRRTRRIQLMRLVTAVVIGLAVPLAIAAWPYV